MRVLSSGFVDGVILDKYGKRGERDIKTHMPTLSFPIEVVDAPKDTKSFAIVFDDPDSVPVCGFKWIHWLAITTDSSIVEGASTMDKNIIQGENSWGVSLYGGMAPPDRPHEYVVTVYALDILPSLTTGFTMSDLDDIVTTHTIDSAVLKGMYDN